MEKEFIPYQEALELKQLGFDEPCIKYYWTDGMFVKGYEDPFNYNKRDNVISSPLYQQAFRWFRENGYDTKIQKESEGLYFGFYWTGVAWIVVGNGTYEEAELECLKKLIEIVKLK